MKKSIIKFASYSTFKTSRSWKDFSFLSRSLVFYYHMPNLKIRLGVAARKLANPKIQLTLGIVIYSNDPETVWNALRIANYSLTEKEYSFSFSNG